MCLVGLLDAEELADELEAWSSMQLPDAAEERLLDILISGLEGASAHAASSRARSLENMAKLAAAAGTDSLSQQLQGQAVRRQVLDVLKAVQKYGTAWSTHCRDKQPASAPSKPAKKRTAKRKGGAMVKQPLAVPLAPKERQSAGQHSNK